MDNVQFKCKIDNKNSHYSTFPRKIKKKTIYIFSLFFLFQVFFIEDNYAFISNDNTNIEEENRLLKLAANSINTDMKTSLEQADSAYKISLKLNDTKGQIRSLKVLVDILLNMEDYKSSLKYGLKLLNTEKASNILNPDTLLDLGEICLELGLLARSLSYYKEILAESGHKYTGSEKADIFINIGTVYGQLGDYQNELKYYLKSYKILKYTKTSEQFATLLNNLGSTYASLKDIDRSLEFYKKAYSLSVKIMDRVGEALALGNIAGTYIEKKKYKYALKTFKLSLEVCRAIDDKAGISYSLSGLSECYMEMKSVKLAEKYSREALAVSIESGDKMEIAENYLTLSAVALKVGKKEESLNSLKNAEKIGKETGSLSLSLNIYKSYADYYKEIKDYRNAFGYMQKFLNINEKIYSKDSRSKTIEMQTMYETLEKDNQIKLLNKDKYLHEIEANRQQLIKNGFILAIIIIILFFFLIYNRYRLKKKAHMELKMAHNGLEAANHIITEKNKHITDSINYAQNIQLAILPLKTKTSHYIKDYFIFYKPKDIVSGDFYWFNEIKGNVYVAVVDCTGHGVPGAFMSMIGYSLLNQILLEKKIYDPAGILEALSIAVRDILKQGMDGVKSNDGMDVCLCCLNSKENSLIFAGARRPLLYIKKEDIATVNASIIEIKGTRRSIGGSRIPERRQFENNKISTSPGDMFYLTSDGYSDQSSPDGTKFSSSALRMLLAKISCYNISEQEDKISSALRTHQKSEEQRDDITVFGFKIS